ncbi:hypothetical protein AB7M49_004201 [Bradyrhizobium elkanii]
MLKKGLARCEATFLGPAAGSVQNLLGRPRRPHRGHCLKSACLFRVIHPRVRLQRDACPERVIKRAHSSMPPRRPVSLQVELRCPSRCRLRRVSMPCAAGPLAVETITLSTAHPIKLVLAWNIGALLRRHRVPIGGCRRRANLANIAAVCFMRKFSIKLLSDKKDCCPSIDSSKRATAATSVVGPIRRRNGPCPKKTSPSRRRQSRERNASRVSHRE